MHAPLGGDASRLWLSALMVGLTAGCDLPNFVRGRSVVPDDLHSTGLPQWPPAPIPLPTGAVRPAGFVGVGGRGYLWTEDGALRRGAFYSQGRNGWDFGRPARIDVSPVIQVVAIGEATCALHTDGTMSCSGAPYTDGSNNVDHPERWSVQAAGIRGLSAGQSRICRCADDGTVACWNPTSLDGPVQFIRVEGIPPAVSVSVGDDLACVLSQQGTVHCWLFSSYPPTVQTVAGVDRIERLAVGGGHACAARGDGAVFCWAAGYGATRVPIPGHGPLRSLHAAERVVHHPNYNGPDWQTGSDITFAVLADGRVFRWFARWDSRRPNGATHIAPVEDAFLRGSSWFDVAPNADHGCGIWSNALRCWSIE